MHDGREEAVGVCGCRQNAAHGSSLKNLSTRRRRLFPACIDLKAHSMSKTSSRQNKQEHPRKPNHASSPPATNSQVLFREGCCLALANRNDIPPRFVSPSSQPPIPTSQICSLSLGRRIGFKSGHHPAGVARLCGDAETT